MQSPGHLRRENEALRDRISKLSDAILGIYDSLLRHVWATRESDDHRVVHAQVKRLCRNLGDDASNPDAIVTERRVGYRVRKQNDRSGGQP